MNQHDLLNVRHASLDEAKTAMTDLLEKRPSNYSLDAQLYNDPHMFRIDMEEVFQKEWLFVGMTSEIPKKGDYITVEIGQNPVLILRDGEGNVNAFHNTCRHRGSILCTEHRGGANPRLSLSPMDLRPQRQLTVLLAQKSIKSSIEATWPKISVLQNRRWLHLCLSR